jgi:molybdopterin-binding protein
LIQRAENAIRESISFHTGETSMKLSARNVIKGKVKKVTHGAVNSEVVVELPGGVEVVSIITKTSAENLGLAAGKEVYTVIKASSVMLAVD